MEYITGRCAFGVPDDSESIGIWNLRKSDFLEDGFVQANSDNSPLGDWGIRKNEMLPYREFCTWNLANHVRAYVDFLVNRQFDQAEGLFEEGISSPRCRQDIFMLVYGKLRNLPYFNEINDFMLREFGNNWTGYVGNVEYVAKNLSDNKEMYEAALADKRAYDLEHMCISNQK